MLERFLLWIEDVFEQLTKHKIKYPDKAWAVLVLALSAGTILELEILARKIVVLGGSNFFAIFVLAILASIIIVVFLAVVHSAVATLTGRSVEESG